jgi:hypothetical protein
MALRCHYPSGSFCLVHAAYPERVLGLATRASDDSADPSRLRALPWRDRYVTSSSLLLGAWGLGVGAPTFLGGGA